MDIKKHIINISRELEIDIIGFTYTEPYEELRNFLESRKKKRYDTEFEEKNIDLRIDPFNILHDSRSIIVIGMSYNTENSKKIREDDRIGILSKSSWGVDYHKVLREKLEELVKEIKKVCDFKYRIIVDTGSLVDREVAKRANIGWYGRNNSIINDIFGSFIFIGYIITDLEIEADMSERVEEKCMNCRTCIDSCPTSAIEEGYIINARKCVSYLTQTKERIPYELRDKMGTKVYGCDTCQLVCPYNKKAVKVNSRLFIPKVTNGYISLYELFNISNKEFKKKYGHMAGSWRGKNILKRNCIIALGNIKDKESINILKESLNNSSTMIREYSAWSLLKIDKELGKKILNEHIKNEKDDEVRVEMEKLLEYFEGDSTY